MKNVRYSGPLQQHNSTIIELGSPFVVPWIIAADAIRVAGFGGAQKALEFGCGEGHASIELLSRTEIDLDLLDINPKMISVARRRLRRFKARTTFITQDVHTFLSMHANYSVMFSSFVLHNFPRVERPGLLIECRKAMQRDGLFILDDCIPPDRGDKACYARQIERYQCLPFDIRDPLIRHVEQDATPEYRMPEHQILEDLEKAGFKSIEVLDRIEREALIVARA
ncbi:MAG: hypothetical protein JWM46_131 [Candidatus Kaiserbacteria bacterium]|nr:hypothetical protein [Candidatus Kaiserbacteria bacterium]